MYFLNIQHLLIITTCLGFAVTIIWLLFRNKKTKDNTPIQEEMVAFYGIHKGQLFVQLATKGNKIIYAAETEMKEKSKDAIIPSLYKLFPNSFKETDIKCSRGFSRFDGKKIVTSGRKKIIDCETVEDLFPSISKFIFSFIIENGKY